MTPASRPRGRILVFFSCKGGVGITFLTTQLGCLLALRWQLKVLVIDGVHPFGDAALMLSPNEPKATLGDLLHRPERFDEALLESALLWPQHPSGCAGRNRAPYAGWNPDPRWVAGHSGSGTFAV